jgi:beta-glucuronidase
MLYPIDSETREKKDLSGVWNFMLDKEGVGEKEKWFSKKLSDTILMPVPASYNDVTQSTEIRDYIGDVWYETTFFVPVSWSEKRIFIRFGGVSQNAKVWINGIFAVEHTGGFLPFESDVSEMLKFGGENRMIVKVNNVLSWTSLPVGEIKNGRQEYFHDFFNYSGIHRPVFLVAVPKNHIVDITVKVRDNKKTASIVDYRIVTRGNGNTITVKLFDEEKNEVAKKFGTAGQLVVRNAKLWQPGKPYLYTLTIESVNEYGESDVYRLPVGIRTVEVKGKRFLINGKPFYFKGFGKHEDMNIKGKGYDEALAIKDFNLLKWIGANSFRTSHYPYAEEMMNLADRLGVVIIDEVPAVGMNMFDKNEKIFVPERVGDKTLACHIRTIDELIDRDKNHPSVIMWSAGNEPASYEEGAFPYFTAIAGHMRKLDDTRPITLVNCSPPGECKIAQLFDVICVNRYFGWYSDSGRLEVIASQLRGDLLAWYARFGKPILLSEYGADAISGFHQEPPVMFSEEFQCEFLKQYHAVLDTLDFIIGEHVWAFADFATKQGITRVGGNKKGVFTRERQPKMSAHMLKERWNGK